MIAVVIAGGTPGADDPLASAAAGRPKALIELAHKPMGQWVLEALDEAPSVTRICLVGLPPDHGLSTRTPLTNLEDQGSGLRNARAGLKWARAKEPSAQYALLSAADIPAVRPAIVEWRIEQGMTRLPFDLDYAVVEKETMEAHFPSAARSYIHFRDATVCGGDLNLVRLDMVLKEAFWERFSAARKSPWRQAALFGFDTVLLMLLRRLTLEQMRKRVEDRLGLAGNVHLSPYPELAMDVDKPEHLALLQRTMTSELSEDA